MKSLETIAKQHKAELVLFETYEHVDGAFVFKDGKSYTFTIDKSPIFDLDNYFLPYMKGKEKWGINVSYARYWIIPMAGTTILCNQKELLKTVFLDDWHEKTVDGIKYFLVPKDWLEENCKIIKE